MFLIIITTAVALILLLLILAFILPKHYSVTVTQTINKPKDVVFDYIRLFKHQTEYSEWLKKDPELHTNITGEDGVIGSMLRWVSFIEEAEAGDLAFFDNEEGKITHVGILMNDNYIIHAHGKVRIDRLDHLGIMNVDTKRHTHKLRVIKKII